MLFIWHMDQMFIFMGQILLALVLEVLLQKMNTGAFLSYRENFLSLCRCMYFSLWFFLKTMWYIFDSALIILDFIQGLFLIALDVLSWDKTLITLFGIRSQISLNTYKLCLVCVISIDGLDSHYNTILPNLILVKQFQFGDACFCPYIT